MCHQQSNLIIARFNNPFKDNILGNAMSKFPCYKAIENACTSYDESSIVLEM